MIIPHPGRMIPYVLDEEGGKRKNAGPKKYSVPRGNAEEILIKVSVG